MTSRRGVLLAGGGTLLAAIAGVKVWREGDVGFSTGASAADDSVSVPVSVADGRTGFGVDLSYAPVFGSLDAPVDVYYWTDYQSVHCARFESETLPRLLSNEVTDGVARVVVLDYPVVGEGSMTAAVVATCVWNEVRDDDPAAFRRWHRAVFEAQEPSDSGGPSRESLLSVAESVDGVPAGAVEQCLETNRDRMASHVYDEASIANAHGVNGVPGFSFYGSESGASRTMTGTQPYGRFENAIEQVRSGN